MDDDELTYPLDRASQRPSGNYVLVVVDGPDVGKRFVLDPTKARFLVGNSPACELQLTDRAVSRRHLAIGIEGDKLSLDDLGSTNGTSVEAANLTVGRARLSGGEKIHIGSTTLELTREAPSKPAAKMDERTKFGKLVGGSREMRALYPLCDRLANTDIPVIIEGETGTGKEVLAECLHEEGPRAAGPFIVFDCTAVPPTLVESELFGHEKGAFTGAVSTRMGVFEEANGGTLLIDEIGDLELSLQAKLLRALEKSEVRRVGGNKWIKVDVRVMAATRRDLDRAVQDGTFRDDLFHRLAVGRIELPPLRRRESDIGILVRHFCKQLGGHHRSLPPEVVASWERMPWPGNARELKNAVARRLALGDLADLHPTAPGSMPPPAPVAKGLPAAKEIAAGEDLVEQILAMDLPLGRAREHLLREFEQRYTERILAQHGGVVTKAAAASGIARRHFQRLRAKIAKP